MKTDWERDLTKEQIDVIKYTLENNKVFVEKILSILDRMVDEEDRGELSLTAYDNPSWAYKQADRNGARRAYTKVKALFDNI